LFGRRAAPWSDAASEWSFSTNGCDREERWAIGAGSARGMHRAMDNAERRRRGELFRALHDGAEILVLPNPWDRGSARLLANAGFRALATTSAGLAFSLGRRDGDAAVNADETFAHVRDIVEATTLPVSADLENGFGESPEAVAQTIRRAGSIGLAGASIEDATYRAEDPILDRSLAVERIHAAVEAARSLSHPFVLTARAENFIRGRPDLDDTLWRLQAYERAGADVLFGPGLPDEDALRLACRSLTRPFNYVVGCGPTRFTLAELRDIGVRRVSIGTTFIRRALASTLAAAREILDAGTFAYLEGLPTVGDFNELIAPKSAGG
jgi:2-methylisocitrate lyase-like PEP mutase family enzyme